MADHLERIGQTVGDYRLVSWLGGGGFGNVYLAEHTQDSEQVALKVLEIRLTKDEDFRGFLNEARMMRLHHPHIVPLSDFGLSHEGTPFLVMEYAPLGTLRDRHPKGSQVPLLTVVEYAKQVASALAYAHTRRVVHRDVKPENMLVRADGTILLSDFGIATTAHSTHSLSANQGIGGTIPYMAPEQLEGHPRIASDQYALGIVIYEWLAGRCPFRGTAVEVAMQHAMKLPPSLVKQMPGLPREVEEVLFKALAKHPKDRFASVQAFLQALQDASDYLPTLHELSNELFPKGVSPVTPMPAAPQPPVADSPPAFPSSRVSEPITFPPSRKQSATWETNPEPEPATKKKRTMPVTGSIPVNIQPLTASSPPQETKERVAIWRFGKQQLIACGTGLLLFILLGLLASDVPGDATYRALVIGIFVLAVGVASIPFLAALAGPWVGLFTGSVSLFVSLFMLIAASTLFTGHGEAFGSFFGYFYSSVGWEINLGTALFGFIIGFTHLKTHGQFRHFRSIAYVEGITIVVLVVLELIATLRIASLISFYNPYIFPEMFLFSLPALILLLAALAICGRFQKRVMKSSKYVSSSKSGGGLQRGASQRLALPRWAKRRHSRPMVVLLIALVLMLLAATAYGSITGRWLWNTSQWPWIKQPLSSVTWSASQFVAVGGSLGGFLNDTSNTVLTSPDGQTWTSQNASTSQILYDVAGSGSQFVAVGRFGVILTSPDGHTWATQNAGTTQILNSVTWSGTQFVAVGYGGTILTSPDGQTWTSQNGGTSQFLNSVIWAGTQFVVVAWGDRGTILTSPDGQTWATQDAGTSQFLSDIAWSDTQFVAVGDSGTILTSPDGRTWTTQNAGTPYNLSGVAWSGRQFVAVGDGGTILTSPDGQTWTAQNAGTSQPLSDIAWSGTQFVVVGTGIILTSPDGHTWSTA